MSAFAGPNSVESGLVGYWDAGNTKSYPGSGTTWTDLSGNGNNGTLTNGPTFNSGNGGSIVFDGVDDTVPITSTSSFQNQNFTVSVWVNPGVQNAAIITMLDFDHTGSPYQGWALQSEDATTNRYYYLGWFDGSIFQPSGAYGAGKGIQVTTSSWQNIVYSKNSTSLLGYLNGVQVYTATATSATASYQSSRTIRIGSCVSAASRNFKGNISNVTIYNRGLSSSEVLQNFNALKGRFRL